MNSLPEVNNVVLTFATGQLLVDADDLDKALEVLRELAEKEEPGTIIEDLKRPGSIGNNTADVAHIHKHTDGHNHTHHHHHHDGEHQHNHGECTCGCCESEEHVQNHNKKTSLLSAFLDEKKELASIGAGIVFFAAGIAAEHFTNSAIIYISFFIISYIILGGEVLATAVKNLFRGKVFDENFLMGIATIGAFVIGEYPEAAGVMLFYRIGELFEDVAVGRSRKQIMDAVDMRPETVRLMVGGKLVNSNPANVKPGDIIEVRPGDRIPLDGVVTEGESRIDTSAVTGEPVPVSISEGSHVLSGCVNVSGVIYLKVEKILEESMVSRILEAVENAAASKPHIDRFITKFASTTIGV